ncbi:zinc finger and SCAN domain-containing protein 31-like isoform X2 [Hemicordylus capensis]|uniref:zinc finger and SCAN domain-containing protein 31-like isoform X2 n=1 Tax=Hemicordylus capensis TaxID=884348 RepID=UPI002302BB55|nr:zinc finger and SCAN domain-containing protein 31-like isoform X2 [Hemicordylus capensis]
MAAEDSTTLPSLGFQFQAALKQQRGIKMEAGDLTDTHDIQAVCIGEPLAWAASAHIKQEPEEEHWEAQQKRELLKVAQLPHSGWGHSPFREAILWDDTKAFPASFEGADNSSKWLTGEWATQQTSVFDGGAQQPSGRPKSSSAGKGRRRGKNAILLKEGVGAEAQRQQFRHFCFPETRGLRQVYSRLRELCHQWLQPERRSKEEILELVILEQFMTVLPQEVQSWVRERDPETCAHVIALAEDFLMRQQEAEHWEQEAPGTFVEVTVDSPEGEHVPSDTWQGPLSKEIKQEENGDAGSIGGSRESENAEEEQRGGGSEPSELCQIFPRRSQGPLPLQSESFEEGCGSKSQQDQPPVMIWDEAVMHAEGNEAVTEAVLHGKEIKHLCPECGRNFQHKSTLIRHQKMHTGEKPHVCLECGKTFRRRDKLIRHQRIHTGQKPHECPECGKRFRERGKLINHQRIHTGEKPYTCPVCEKTYRWKEEFVKHLRIHTGERPYECCHCRKTFISKAHLVSHHRIHTGEKPFECLECRRRFCSKQSLAKHQRVHTGDRSFECQDCGRIFHYISNFTKHQRIHMNDGIL